MPTLSMIFGGLLSLLGVVLYLVSESHSPTALIPAAFGVPLIILGLIARSGERARMHAMHGAAMVGVVGAVAGLVMLGIRVGQGRDWNLAMTGMALMALLSGIFVGTCVNSFIAARRARRQREGQ